VARLFVCVSSVAANIFSVAKRGSLVKKMTSRRDGFEICRSGFFAIDLSQCSAA
jgi:hypothetical protein